eukprot:Blabericola_migrator_1__3360@NODE_1993_length_3449_cov_51_658782_g1269_i0_p1_GENE_NODE_1993_length_3449_cov_51_658782_g1269_i0NODE_1993_length_3449_cov_51_658782_g1269_i0_p1_ORF_typecomplete_len230_score35_45_NODE_1993_length_3449_cov_51_658782_g1269_i012681957
MRSVREKPSQQPVRQINLLAVLLCPVNFPTPFTLLRVLKATPEQVTESASELTKQVSQASQAGLSFFYDDAGSTAEVLPDASQHFTPQQISDGDSAAAGWIAYGGEAIAIFIIVLAVSYKLYQLCAPLGRGHADRLQPSDPDMIPLRVARSCSTAAPLHLSLGGWSRPATLRMSPLRNSAMPRPSAPPSSSSLGGWFMNPLQRNAMAPSALDLPPPYEAPPPYDSDWSV